jgi:hypothetical protein
VPLVVKPKESKYIRVRQYRHINMDVMFFFYDSRMKKRRKKKKAMKKFLATRIV